MSGRDFDQRDIHLALDGELPPEDRGGYEAWLDRSPDMKARAARFAADAERLRAAGEAVLAEPLPDRLTGAFDLKAPGAARIALWRRLAAAAAFVAIGFVAGLAVGRTDLLSRPGDEVRFADSAISAHVIFAAEKLHVVEVKADQRDHLLRWLSNRVGMPLVAPDLAQHGFSLVGGRLLPESGRSAAQFMYEDGSGRRISLYVASDPSRRDTGLRTLREGRVASVFWLDAGYGCAISGDIPEAALIAVAESAYRQLLEGLEHRTEGGQG